MHFYKSYNSTVCFCIQLCVYTVYFYQNSDCLEINLITPNKILFYEYFLAKNIKYVGITKKLINN